MGIWPRWNRRAGSGEPPTLRAALLPFVLAGLLTFALLAVIGAVLQRNVVEDDAISDAKARTQLLAYSAVEPQLTTALLRGDEAAVEKFGDTITRVLNENSEIVRVKLWRSDGSILYSDADQLNGLRFPLSDDKQAALDTPDPQVEIESFDGRVADLRGTENEFDATLGRVLEVYLSLRVENGDQVIFETYQRYDEIRGATGEIWRKLLPWLIGSLLLLWLIQLPMAWSLARRLQARHREREALLARTLDASAVERRRVAADLHDGPVQELAGLSYQLVAAADRPDRSEDELRQSLRDAAGNARVVMRKLRSLLVDIHPPNLHSEGLAAAVTDLAAGVRAKGIAVDVDIAQSLPVTRESEALLFRGAQEALRNVSAHSGARAARVTVAQQNGVVRLSVTDDGKGFSPAERASSQEGGHMGLTLIEELAEHAGGSVAIQSVPGSGTTFTLEVPAT